MLYLLDQVHFHFNPCSKILCLINPLFQHHLFYSNNFAGMVVAIIYINNFVYFALSSFSKPSKLCISDHFVFFRFE
jgi:hypothetical protein